MIYVEPRQFMIFPFVILVALQAVAMLLKRENAVQAYSTRINAIWTVMESVSLNQPPLLAIKLAVMEARLRLRLRLIVSYIVNLIKLVKLAQIRHARDWIAIAEIICVHGPNKIYIKEIYSHRLFRFFKIKVVEEFEHHTTDSTAF
jgi:hypothetical protein